MNERQSIEIQLLSQKQRLAARKRARDGVVLLAGAKPKREDYKSATFGKYPGWLIATVFILCGVMLLAAFFPSASRLFEIGSTTFRHGIDDSKTATLAGICMIFLSETGALLFTLALAVLDSTKIVQRVLQVSIAICGIIALVGNFEVAIWLQDDVSVFSYLEALAPPILTLSTAYVLKEMTLRIIEQRHNDHLRFEDDYKRWSLANENAEQHPQFSQIYANEIKDSIWVANKKVAQKAILSQMSSYDWNDLVNKVMKSDDWFNKEVDATPEVRPLSEALLSAIPSKNGTHKIVE